MDITNAGIIKISGYLVEDSRGYVAPEPLTLEGLVSELNGLDIVPQHLHFERVDLREGDESVYEPNCDLAQCEKYFKPNPTKERVGDREVKVGATYRHFKEGKLVKVLAVAQDTENVGTYSVVYECKDKENNTKIWYRPYEMFLSEVDHKKYPDAKQLYRFEEVVEEC